jgi:hypothetical protein
MSKTSSVKTVNSKQTIIAQLESTFADLKSIYGEKKFEKKIKKAAKLLSPKKKVIKKIGKAKLAPKKLSKPKAGKVVPAAAAEMQ